MELSKVPKSFDFKPTKIPVHLWPDEGMELVEVGIHMLVGQESNHTCGELVHGVHVGVQGHSAEGLECNHTKELGRQGSEQGEN